MNFQLLHIPIPSSQKSIIYNIFFSITGDIPLEQIFTIYNPAPKTQYTEENETSKTEPVNT